MKKIAIYGHSDDLVEVEDMTPKVTPNVAHEEGSYDHPSYVVVGTVMGGGSGLRGVDVFEVEYTSERDGGLWRVKHIIQSGALDVKIATPPEGSEEYTERAEVSGPIDRVDVLREWPVRAESVREELANVDLSDALTAMSDDDVLVVAEIVSGRPLRRYIEAAKFDGNR